MNREQLVQLAVLMNIADDYEELAHIHGRVSEDLEICGVAIAQEETRRALTGLVESGLAKAWWLCGPGPAEAIEGLPAPVRFQDYYFWITDGGKQALASWRLEWPLDDEGELMPGWSPPNE
jgi:hypothetical protein